MPSAPRADNIVAVATPPGRGGVAVVRVSGPDLSRFASSLLGTVPHPRKATFSRFRNAEGELLDEGLTLFFPAPASFTGEDVLELQAHGSPAVTDLLVGRCLELGARLARPGEFTERAYLNNKIDLAQAEAVADLINAGTAAAAKGAARSLSGEFSRAVTGVREELIRLRTLTEALLDFPEESLSGYAVEMEQRFEAVFAALATLQRSAGQGRLLREGVTVVLLGPPNVGKSSLLNRLAREEVAIVTPIPGTTRDPIRESVTIAGVTFHFIDTAGLNPVPGEIEAIGIQRSWQAASRADLVLRVEDASVAAQTEMGVYQRLPVDTPVFTVFNKCDLRPKPLSSNTSEPDALLISAKTGEGLDALCAELLKRAGWQESAEPVFLARTRHLHALEAARREIEQAYAIRSQAELAGEHLRAAQSALGTILGEFSADDLLGAIFSDFCIGK